SFLHSCTAPHGHLHSFPTRRSSDLLGARRSALPRSASLARWKSWISLGKGRLPQCRKRTAPSLSRAGMVRPKLKVLGAKGTSITDRESTRLNSSHVKISYAVFCLKK